MNDLAEPLVFENLKIIMTRPNATRNENILPAIAAGRSPYVRWAKRVTIDRLVPVETREFYGSIVGDFKTESEIKAALAFQNSILAPAIQALKNVNSVL